MGAAGVTTYSCLNSPALNYPVVDGAVGSPQFMVGLRARMTEDKPGIDVSTTANSVDPAMFAGAPSSNAIIDTLSKNT